MSTPYSDDNDSNLSIIQLMGGTQVTKASSTTTSTKTILVQMIAMITQLTTEMNSIQL